MPGHMSLSALILALKHSLSASDADVAVNTHSISAVTGRISTISSAGSIRPRNMIRVRLRSTVIGRARPQKGALPPENKACSIVRSQHLRLRTIAQRRGFYAQRQNHAMSSFGLLLSSPRLPPRGCRHCLPDAASGLLPHNFC